MSDRKGKSVCSGEGVYKVLKLSQHKLINSFLILCTQLILIKFVFLLTIKKMFSEHY